ncbi:MAG: PspC domain-containing protein [Planctomycetota bacterium]
MGGFNDFLDVRSRRWMAGLVAGIAAGFGLATFLFFVWTNVLRWMIILFFILVIFLIGFLAMAASKPEPGPGGGFLSKLDFAAFLRFLRVLSRSRKDRVVGGVCGGLGAATPFPGWVWRTVFLLATPLGGAGAMAYAVLLVSVPAAAADAGDPPCVMDDDTKIANLRPPDAGGTTPTPLKN